jgi:uncharacterized RDD family membrane protein YckC
MFTIIGGDGREYGPASTEQIRAWLASGRANLETRAKAAGSDEWRRLGDYAEFSEGAGAPPVIVAVDTGLADRGVRLLAKIVDEICSLICAIPGAAILGVTFLRTWVQSMNGGEAASLEDIDVGRAVTGFTVLALGLLALAIVQIWLISTRGQSIGKIVFGVRIVRHEDGTLPGFVHGWLLRNLVPGIIGMVPFGLGMIFSLVDVCFIFRADRRCIHDLIAGTRVVKV